MHRSLEGRDQKLDRRSAPRGAAPVRARLRSSFLLAALPSPGELDRWVNLVAHLLRPEAGRGDRQGEEHPSSGRGEPPNKPVLLTVRAARPAADRPAVGQKLREPSMSQLKNNFPPTCAALTGHKDDSEPYFAHSATLRVFGERVEPEEITAGLGIDPTYCHRKGDRRSLTAPPWEHGMWSYSPSLLEDRPLGEHIDALWARIKPRKSYLFALKAVATVDVFLGYRSNSDTAGIEVPHHSLDLFVELQIPLGLSIIIA